MKDSFAFVDSIASKLPEVISVPESVQEAESSNDNLSSRLESSDISSSLDNSDIASLLESSASSSSIQSMSIDSTQPSPPSVMDDTKTMTSLEPSSLFSSIEHQIGSDMFQRMDSFDILNAIDLDITAEQENVQISGSDLFLDGQQTAVQTVDIDLTSDNIDFLEINSGELLNLGEDVPILTSADDMIMINNNPQKIEVTEVKQNCPDTTTDDCITTQFASEFCCYKQKAYSHVQVSASLVFLCFCLR